MSDVKDPAGKAPAAAAGPAPKPGGRKRRAATRWTRRVLGVAIALFAAALFSLLTIDIGGMFGLRQRAEKAASNYLKRPMHIGKLSMFLTPGDFALENVVIEGYSPTDKPFLTAKRVTAHIDWLALLDRHVTFEVKMTDWEMVIEKWADHHSMPSLVPKSTGEKRQPGPVKYTVSFVYADRGQFTYDDHTTPWSVVARNLNVDLAKSLRGDYVGTARFKGGTTHIQTYLPMWTDMTAVFQVDPQPDGTLLHFPRIDLVTDGAVSRVAGAINLGKFPEQTFAVRSRVNFPRMREIFFGHESWTLSGEGLFDGVFQLDAKSTYNLRGDFTSDLAGVNTLRFPNLRGSLEWQPGSFTVTPAQAGFYGGQASFAYALTRAPGADHSTARFDTTYSRVDVRQLGRLMDLKQIDVLSRADGTLSMTWENGRFKDTSTGSGDTVLTAPEGAALAPARLPPPVAAAPSVPTPPLAAPPSTTPLPAAPAAEPDQPRAPTPPTFDPYAPIGPVAAAGHLIYSFDDKGWHFDDSWVAHDATYVAFSGDIAADRTVHVPFRAVSTDWQKSDRLLAAIISETSRTGRTGAIEVGGQGSFENGLMTQTFSDPRFTGHFAGEAIKAWGVTWGRAIGDVDITKTDVTVKNGLIGNAGGPRIATQGKFNLGYRTDGGEEIRATFHVDGWPLSDFRTAFGLADWPVEGFGTADITLHGPYRAPLGSGVLRVENGMAWREPFDAATGQMSFEGKVLRVTSMRVAKGTGLVTGEVRIDYGVPGGAYSFDADGDVAVETLANFKLPKAPLSGQLHFSASGAGRFDSPQYTFKGRVRDLFAGDEGVGDVVGSLTVRDKVLTIDSFDAVDPATKRLDISGRGRIALNGRYDADVELTRVRRTSIDPYLKFFAPVALEYTGAIVTGGARIVGPLADWTQLRVDATVDDAELKFFDYQLVNDGPIQLGFGNGTLEVQQFHVTGNDTRLGLTGTVSVRDKTVDLRADGTANLAILHAIKGFGDLNVSGSAALNAQFGGPFDDLRFSGYADVDNGKLRLPAFNHSLESLHGRITFSGDTLDFSGLKGMLGGGDIQFGGDIRFKGFKPDEFNLTAEGHSMDVRYPTGFTSTIDADLTLRGPYAGPTLGGTVTVQQSVLRRRPEAEAGIAGFVAAGTSGGGSTGPAPPPPPTADDTSVPLAYDIRVIAPPQAFIDAKDVTIKGSIHDFTITGTAARPVLTGSLQIDSGTIYAGGTRITIQPSSIDFINPARFEPSLNIQATATAHAGGQTYIINIRITGTTGHLTPELSSEPSLPLIDILGFLFGQSPNVGTAELRRLQGPQALEAQRNMMVTAVAQFLTLPFNVGLSQALEKTNIIDTVQINTLLNVDPTFQQFDPSARVTLAKRLSDKLYLTYSRDLTHALELYLLEYEQSDLISWVLSRNEDHTFALDFRIRHVY